MNPPEYIQIGIIRYVKDYYYSFKTYCKRRWIGQNLLEFFTKEFMQYTPEYYEKAILQGKILINSQQQSLDYVLKDNDIITHDTIRKEPPVFNLPIDTIYEDDDLLVVNKPPSIPVHPCGQFHYNSIVEILENEYKKGHMYPAHRIDKMTSGVLIMAKKPKHNFGVEEKQKLYLARVQGEFPYQEFICDSPMYCVSVKKGEFDVIQPSHVDTNDKKEAKTIFKKVWYDLFSNSSLLECRPITGRTHQIRVHLKSLGYPIINDICYGGPNIGNIILRQFCTQNYIPGQTFKKKIKTVDGGEKNIFCYKNEIPECFEWTISDEHAMEIYLHSWQYQMGDKKFEAKKPYWAEQSFNFRIIQHLVL